MFHIMSITLRAVDNIADRDIAKNEGKNVHALINVISYDDITRFHRASIRK